jgi:hypothetical protein
MKKRQDIINQIVFILILGFIIFLIWGYGAGWLGASADVTNPPQSQGFFSGVGNGLNKLENLPAFQDEHNLHWAL